MIVTIDIYIVQVGACSTKTNGHHGRLRKVTSVTFFNMFREVV